MLLLQLMLDGLIHGCAIGLVAVTFAYVYETTGVFHVAHAGIFSLGGYLGWDFVNLGLSLPFALTLSMAGCAVIGAAIQKGVYEPLMKRGSTKLVQLIASLGLVAVLQNAIALIFTPNVLQFDNLSWRTSVVSLGAVDLNYPKILIALTSLIATGLLMLFSSRSLLGRRIRAVASNRDLAEITRLRPYDAYIYVLAISSALVAVSGVFVGIDQALQPYSGFSILLTAIVAVIAGGLGSLRSAFVISVILGVLQNLVLAMVPGRWSQALTFAICIVFILLRPAGLSQLRIRRAT